MPTNVSPSNQPNRSALDGAYLDLARHPDANPLDGIALVRVEGGLYFANADAVRTRLLAAAKGARTVILDAETIPFVDVTAAEMLDRVAGDLRRGGVRLVALRAPVA